MVVKDPLKNPFGRELLTYGEIQYLTRYARSTITKWVNGGYVRRYGTCGKYLIPWGDVKRLLENPQMMRQPKLRPLGVELP
jgi:hypothetical protein